MIRHFLRHLRLGLRHSLRRPGESATIVVVLGLGIGLAATAWAVVWGTYLRSLPFPGADRLVRIAVEGETADAAVQSVPWEIYRELGEVPGLESHGIWLPFSFDLSGLDGPARKLPGAHVSASILPMSGIAPIRGRFFTAEEEKAGQRLALLREGSVPGIDLGDTFRLYGEVYSVVGVMPADFRFPFSQHVWVPLRGDSAGGYDWRQVLARADGRLSSSRLAALEAVLDTRFAALASPTTGDGSDDATGPPRSRVTPFATAYHSEEMKTGHVAATIGAALLLFLACANAAHLLLARGLRRRREMAVRISLGASRGELLRQLLVETLVLALAGGGLAALVTRWGTHLYRADMPQLGPRWVRVEVTPEVVLVIVGLALLTTLLAGLAPAWRAARTDPRMDLAGGRSHGRSRGESLLVILQLAGSVALLAATGLLVRTVADLEERHATLERADVVTARYSMIGVTDDRLRDWQRLRRELEAMPEVASAAVAYHLPPDPESGWALDTEVLGEETSLESRIILVSPGTFETLGQSIVAGRDLRPSDGAPDAPHAALVDTRMAERLRSLGVEPLGARLVPSGRLGQSESGHEIRHVVGVVPAFGDDWTPRVYVSLDKSQVDIGHLLVRLHAPASAFPGFAENLAEAVHRAVPGAPIQRVRTLEQVVDDRLATRTSARRAFLVLGGVALALAAVGLYGILAVGVGRRRHEIGIRAALGAEPGEIVRLVVRSGLVLVAVGAAAGVLVAVWLGRSLEALLHGVEPWDPASLGAAVGVLLLVALAASWIPARRAARIDPASVLREQ